MIMMDGSQVSMNEAREGAENLVLRFSHNIIEHLGLKLYQNRPTNVVAELVSNAWDAGAQQVWIDTHTAPLSGDARFITVADDGGGMTLQLLAENYLVIGLAKDRSQFRSKGRYPMGRKGIGKLAPFGIAGQVDVCSIAADTDGNRKATWIRLRSTLAA
jgi:HSP90 family molecular chaperone